MIKVTWSAVTQDGSSEIISYSLEIDDGTGGDFVSVVGAESQYLLTYYTIVSNIEKATLYRLRYRALNKIGWSAYSPIAYIRAATVPQAPQQPMLLSSTSSSITVLVPRSEDNMGSPITSYKLYIDSGDDFTSSFVEVMSYDGISDQHTLETAADSLTTGLVYRVKSVAVNEYGPSDYSFELIVGMGQKAPAPAQVVRDVFFESPDSMRVLWTQPSDNDLPVTGYLLQMDDGLIGDF